MWILKRYFFWRLFIFAACSVCSNLVLSQTPSPPPPPPQDRTEIVYTYMEKMPVLEGCEGIIGTEMEKKDCTDEILRNFFRNNLQYPETALEEDIQGSIHASFIVRPDGVIIDPKIENDLGGGCKEEALRLLMLFQKKCRFTPQSSRGRAVLIQFRTEIVFSLKH